MFAPVHLSRVLPILYPGTFPEEKAVAADHPLRDQAALAAPPADPVLSRRMKSLYQRNLRNRHDDTLTYSGVVRSA